MSGEQQSLQEQASRSAEAEQGSTPKSAPAVRVSRIALIVVLFGLLDLHAATLTDYPAPFVDEPWAAARAWTFRHNFTVFSTLDAGVFDRLPGWATFFPFLPTALQSVMYIGADRPALVPLRSESLAAGLVLLLMVFWIGRSLYGPGVGICAMLLVGLSVAFFSSAHLARYDIYAALFGYAAIALYLSNHRRAPWLYGLAGFLACMALDSHANGILIGAAFPALFLVDRGIRVVLERAFWTFVLGVAIGIGTYLSIHMLPSPHGFSEFNRIAWAPTHVPPLLTFDLAIMRRGLQEFWWSVHASSAGVLGIIGVAFAMLLARRSPADRRLLAMVVPILLAFALFVRIKQWYYEIIYWPCFGLVIAALFGAAFERARRSIAYGVLAAVLLLACGAGTFANLPGLSSEVFASYNETTRELARFVGPDDRVLAKQSYWFPLYDRTYYSYEGLKYYQRYAPSASLEQAFAAFQPDIFILDSALMRRVTDQPGSADLYMQHLSLSRRELDGMLARRGRLVTRMLSPLFGDIRVYRLDWSDLRKNGKASLTPGAKPVGRGAARP